MFIVGETFEQIVWTLTRRLVNGFYVVYPSYMSIGCSFKNIVNEQG